MRERHSGKTPFQIEDAIKDATAWRDFRFGFRPTPLAGVLGGFLGGFLGEILHGRPSSFPALPSRFKSFQIVTRAVDKIPPATLKATQR
jgi:hypothetical protein